jgi:hypothetical protein
MLLISPLFFGLITATGALVAELFVFSFFIQDSATQTLSATNTNFVFATGGLLFLFLTALLEECFKYLLLKKTLPQDTSLSHIIVFLLLFSIGFSGLEITLLISNSPIRDTTIILHSIGIFLLHLTTISLFGFMLSHRSLRKYALLSLSLAVLIHFVYNVIILYQSSLPI